MNALEPVGPQAALIAAETWYLLAVMTAVFVLTMAALAIALLRRREPQPPSRSNRVVAFTVIAGNAMPWNSTTTYNSTPPR